MGDNRLLRWAFWVPVWMLFALNAASWAQSEPYPSQPAPATSMTVEGTVTGMGSYRPSQAAPEVLRIGMRLDTGGVMTVQVSPDALPASLNIRVGDRIKVTGVMTDIDGVPMLAGSGLQEETALSPPQPAYSDPAPPVYQPDVYYYPDVYPSDYGVTWWPTYWWPSWWWGGAFVDFNFGFGRRFHDGDRFDRFSRVGGVDPAVATHGTAQWHGVSSSSSTASHGSWTRSAAPHSTWTGATSHSTWTGTTSHSTWTHATYHSAASPSVSRGGWSSGSHASSYHGSYSGGGGSRGGGHR